MTKGTLAFVALVALIVGVLIGWLLWKPKGGSRNLLAGGHIIDVDKHGQVNKEEAVKVETAPTKVSANHKPPIKTHNVYQVKMQLYHVITRASKIR